MATKALSVRAQKPVSVWKRPVKIKGFQLASALAKGIFNTVAGNAVGAAEDVEQIVGAVGLDVGVGELVWQLVVRAIVRGLSDLLGEQPFPEAAVQPDLEKLQKSLEDVLSQGELSIERAFFERPAQLPLLRTIEEPLTAWLVSHAVPVSDARNIVRRLPSYFTYALHEEWRASPTEYKPLLDALHTPFANAGERERAWERYAARLQRQINEPMLGEAFGIVHVYVPLCAYYEEEGEFAPPTRESDAGRLREPTGTIVRRVVNLAEELSSWVERGTKKNAIRVIAGGPGSGKSSFSKMFSARLVAQGKRVLYVPLHLIDPEKDLEIAIERFVRQQDIIQENPLDSAAGEPRLLLILDGLDELAMQGKASAEAAQKLIGEVQRFVANRNQIETRIQVLLGGRDVVVQLNRSELREPRQVLHLLPYYLTYQQRGELFDPGRLTNDDRRDLWWQSYGAVKANGFRAMPYELRRPDLDEITAQPLLGYLVALSFAHGTIDFSDKTKVNRNAIYEDLIVAVHERTYAGQRHASVRGLTAEQFRQLLEEVGLATWHGDGRTTTVAAIHECCKLSGLDTFLDAFEEGAKSGATRLLTAFYFRQNEGRRDGERTFEFTHKSFREYLTARRIMRALERIEDELATRKKKPGRGWSEREALVHWAEIAGPTAIDAYIVDFVEGEARHAGQTRAKDWQTLLARLIGFMLRYGMPMEGLNPRLRYAEETRYARNAEEAMLACMSAFAGASGMTSDPEWPNSASFGTWLRRLVGQRSEGAQAFTPQCLRGLNLGGQSLVLADLFQANLERADLSTARLDGANLSGANLSSANLSSANLSDTNFSNADLSGANLSGANLSGANLSDASLSDANLSGARIVGGRISGAQLQAAKGTLRVSNLQSLSTKSGEEEKGPS